MGADDGESEENGGEVALYRSPLPLLCARIGFSRAVCRCTDSVEGCRDGVQPRHGVDRPKGCRADAQFRRMHGIDRPKGCRAYARSCKVSVLECRPK